MYQDDDYVLSFSPRKIDGPHFVAEDREELRGMVGEQVGAEQCDGCGNNVYRIVTDGYTFHAVCSLDDNPDEFTHNEPCGASYPILSTQVRDTVM